MGFDNSFDSDFTAESSFDSNASILRDELAAGETIVWQGQPQVGKMILRSLPISVFGVFPIGFAVIWFNVTANNPFGILFSLAGVLPLLVGAAMIFAPLWAVYAAQRTHYAVTDRRVILCEPSGLGIQVRSYTPDALTNIVRNQRGDGSGDLIFEEIRTRDSDGDRHITRRGFRAIRDVRRVETLIRETLLNERS